MENITTLLNAALLEKQIVVFCPHAGTLAAAVLSLVPMLRPFAWQSLLLPVTPAGMRAFLEAPVPFVLGVQYKAPELSARCGGGRCERGGAAGVHAWASARRLRLRPWGAPAPLFSREARHAWCDANLPCARQQPTHVDHTLSPPRCAGLVRVNVYKDRVKLRGALPPLPGGRRLASELAPHHAALAAARAAAAERPVHEITAEEAAAARRFLQVVPGRRGGRRREEGRGLAGQRPAAQSAGLHELRRDDAADPPHPHPPATQVLLEHMTSLVGDLRLHTIVNVGLSKRTGLLMKEGLLESLPPRDRPFMRAFMETQMFCAHSDAVIAEYCEQA